MTKEFKIWILLFILCSISLAPPTALAQQLPQNNITIECKRMKLSDVFKEIEKVSGYKILFSYDDVDEYHFTGHIKNASITSALNQILRNKPLEYTIDKKFINITLKDKKTVAGTSNIYGTVISAEDNLPVIGAAVRIVDSDFGTITDDEGKFEFKQYSFRGAIIQVSFIGMKTQTLDAQSNMRIILEPDVKKLKDVVVTGIFKKARESYTGAVTTITDEELSI